MPGPKESCRIQEILQVHLMGHHSAWLQKLFDFVTGELAKLLGWAGLERCITDSNVFRFLLGSCSSGDFKESCEDSAVSDLAEGTGVKRPTKSSAITPKARKHQIQSHYSLLYLYPCCFYSVHGPCRHCLIGTWGHSEEGVALYPETAISMRSRFLENEHMVPSFPDRVMFPAQHLFTSHPHILSVPCPSLPRRDYC